MKEAQQLAEVRSAITRALNEYFKNTGNRIVRIELVNDFPKEESYTLRRVEVEAQVVGGRLIV